jgi:hypothetical protein
MPSGLSRADWAEKDDTVWAGRLPCHRRPRSGASLGGWLAAGSSSASGCAPSRRSPGRRSWSGAARHPGQAGLPRPPDRPRLAARRPAPARHLGLRHPGIPPGGLLSARFATYRLIHLPAAAPLPDRGFGLLPAGLRPHDTVRPRRADSVELGGLLAAPGPPVANRQHAQRTIWREEGRDVPRRPHRRPQRRG